MYQVPSLFFSIQISILIVQVYTIISNKQDVLIDYMGLISALKLFIMFLPYFDCSERKNTVFKKNANLHNSLKKCIIFCIICPKNA